mgnify:CR=1 FL=1
MKLDLYINEANDYARDIRVPILHPHVAIIHYDEVGEIRHSLNRIQGEEEEGSGHLANGLLDVMKKNQPIINSLSLIAGSCRP